MKLSFKEPDGTERTLAGAISYVDIDSTNVYVYVIGIEKSMIYPYVGAVHISEGVNR